MIPNLEPLPVSEYAPFPPTLFTWRPPGVFLAPMQMLPVPAMRTTPLRRAKKCPSSNSASVRIST
jgi:hypothetical protein